jgi:RNA polymerase sigma factor (TIGR02999 family)
MASETRINTVLSRAREGDDVAREQLFHLVYEELRIMAHRSLGYRNGQQTLCTTALVNEAYLKLVSTENPPYRSKRYFFGAAARAMRQIIVDLSRNRKSQKRGGGQIRLSLDVDQLAIDQCADEMLELDEALRNLASVDPRLSHIVECRFFGGLSVEQTSEVVGVTPRTVNRDWRKARAWLFQELKNAQTAAANSAPKEP